MKKILMYPLNKLIQLYLYRIYTFFKNWSDLQHIFFNKIYYYGRRVKHGLSSFVPFALPTQLH